MAIKKLFKSYVPSINYVTQRGRTCVFKEGQFMTDVPEEVAELTEVCNSKSNPHIYIDPNESEIDTTLQERIREAQQKATLEVLAEAEAEKKKVGVTQKPTQQNAQNMGAGMSAATLLNVANSANMAGMSAPSNQK